MRTEKWTIIHRLGPILHPISQAGNTDHLHGCQIYQGLRYRQNAQDVKHFTSLGITHFLVFILEWKRENSEGKQEIFLWQTLLSNVGKYKFGIIMARLQRMYVTRIFKYKALCCLPMALMSLIFATIVKFTLFNIDYYVLMYHDVSCVLWGEKVYL